MATVLLETDAWSKRRARAEELAQRWPFAADVLEFVGSLLAVQERAFIEALDDVPSADTLAGYAAHHVMPRIIEVSVVNGPPVLAGSALERFHDADLTELVAGWLRGEDRAPIERYLARASAGPVLEALALRAPREHAHDDPLCCPICRGRPQLGYFAASPENLVTAHRYLVCSRCATSWAFPRLTCAACGETETDRLVVYAEIGTTQAEIVPGNAVKPGAAATATGAHFPHLRIDGCRTCSRYLLTVDLEREGRAVPLVDELGAIPLDLYAKELGMTKIVPNLMGL